MYGKIDACSGVGQCVWASTYTSLPSAYVKPCMCQRGMKVGKQVNYFWPVFVDTSLNDDIRRYFLYVFLVLHSCAHVCDCLSLLLMCVLLTCVDPVPARRPSWTSRHLRLMPPALLSSSPHSPGTTVLLYTGVKEHFVSSSLEF